MRACDRLVQLCADSRWPVERVLARCQMDEYVAMRRVLCRALYVEGYSIAEIARAVEHSRGTVATYVYAGERR